MAIVALPLLQGTLDLLVLKCLSAGPRHGYAIATMVREQTGGDLTIEDAALYQALHRLERKRLIVATWGLSENNRKAKFYELTADGRRQLRADSSTWREYAAAVGRVLDPA